jgi:DNA-binding beta-propeller fold protein YncE
MLFHRFKQLAQAGHNPQNGPMREWTEKWTEGRPVGSGEWTYHMYNNWAKLPPEMSMGNVAGVAVDRSDNVYVFHRGEHPMLIFDRGGQLLASWGTGRFTNPHAVAIGFDGAIYCTDTGNHTVSKFTPDGDLLLRIGVPNNPAPRFSNTPFNACTHSALARNGDIFVSDGYGNARVHKYSPDGKLLLSWGDFGTEEGCFNLVHNITCDLDGWVYVADRENHRVQVFDEKGAFQTQWSNLHRPCGLCTEYRKEPLSYIGEIGPAIVETHDYPKLGPRVSIVDHRGKLVARLADSGAGVEPGRFLLPHGIAVDSRGDIYVGEISTVGWQTRFQNATPPPVLPTLRKLVRATPLVRDAEKSHEH